MYTRLPIPISDVYLKWSATEVEIKLSRDNVDAVEAGEDDVSAAAAADGDAENSRETSEMDYNDLPQHLQLGSQLTFSITVLQASGIPADCTDVFCQFK